jgi:hypothetical protein
VIWNGLTIPQRVVWGNGLQPVTSKWWQHDWGQTIWHLTCNIWRATEGLQRCITLHSSHWLVWSVYTVN